LNVNVELPDTIMNELVEQVVERVLARLGRPEPSPYLSVPEAATLLRAKPQRVHDLLSAGKLTRFKDGGRTLVLRAEVETLVVESQR
jgi:excisionase family DNA binding protein